MLEKVLSMGVGCKNKNQFLAISIWNLLTSLIMTNKDSCNGFFYLNLTPLKDTHIIKLVANSSDSKQSSPKEQSDLDLHWIKSKIQGRI